MRGGAARDRRQVDVTDGIEAALEQAREAAGEKNVSIAGGPGTLNQYLAAGLVDELRLAVVPMLIGRGERIFPDTSPPPPYVCVEHTSTPAVTHLRFERR